jgi:single-stranded-DNA-specific exonuclease
MYYQGIKKTIVVRPPTKKHGHFDGMPPLLARIFAARGVMSTAELDSTLAQLPSPWLLSGMEGMVTQLIAAINQQQRIVIVADIDADGATSCAVAVKGLRLLGATAVEFAVPNRFEYGYGLTPEIVGLVKQQNPDVIITVDNGISSVEGVQAAHAAGIKVLITDHHLPPAQLPDADAIINPNLVGDAFPCKALAGVGVMFYVLMALRSRLREQQVFSDQNPEPKLAPLLDYVALGTVADVVALDQTNRILVQQGLQRIRTGRGHAGLMALIDVAGKNPLTLAATDLGFALGPRLNAAGRMADMSVGIQCLLADDPKQARALAVQLDEMNKERRDVEEQMKFEALALLADMKKPDEHHALAGVCLYEANWHQGVVGILAARIKDQLHRPVIAFAPAGKGIIKGSGRSIPGVHIRDVLSDIATAHPKLLSNFGGHALAAGLSLAMHDYPAFALLFDEQVRRRLAQVDLEQKVLSDGELAEADMTLETADLLQNAAVWGQGFPEPIFHGEFEVVQARIVGQKHLKLVLRHQNGQVLMDAIAFFIDQPERWLGIRACVAAYKLDINEFRGNRSVQFIVQYLEKIA